MPVEAIIAPTETIAGGVVFRGQSFTINHNQLTGNTEGKRRRLIELLQENVLDEPWEDVDSIDPADSDHPDNNSWNTYSDPFRRPDDSIIDEIVFVYQQNPNQRWVIWRGIVCDIILTQANDPTLGGNDRYVLVLRRVSNG